MFSTGGNDYIAAIDNNILDSKEEILYVQMVIGNITTVIQEIYKRGRKIGMQTVYPIGCSPFMRAINYDRTGGLGCMDEAQLFTELHNRALFKALEELERQLEGFRYSFFDSYAETFDRINNPSKYGFEKVEEACCGSGPFRGYVTCGQEEKGFRLCDNVSEYLFF